MTATIDYACDNCFVRVRVRACVCVRARACVRVCVRVRACIYLRRGLMFLCCVMFLFAPS